MILLMEELLHQLICRLFHYLQGLHIPGGCLGFLNHQQYQHNFKNAPTSCSTCDRHWMPYQSDWVFACHFFTHNTWKRTTPWTRKGKSRTSWVTSKYVVWLKTSNHVYINVSHITKYNDMCIYMKYLPTSMVHLMTDISYIYLGVDWFQSRQKWDAGMQMDNPIFPYHPWEWHIYQHLVVFNG